MNILVIDTSTRVEMIAASSDNRMAERTSAAGISHSVTLFDNIKAVLEELNLNAKELHLIGVGTGPGSFTGIRIGVSSARMIAQLLRVPLVGFFSPHLYASSVHASPGTNIIIAFDAKKNRIFGALYRKNPELPVPVEIIPPGDYTVEQLLSGADPRTPAVLAGDGAEKFYDEMARHLPDHTLLRDFTPSGEAGCRLTDSLYSAAPERYADFKAVMPFYARRSDAEVLREIRRNEAGK